MYRYSGVAAPLLHMYGEHVVNAHMATSMFANWAYVHMHACWSQRQTTAKTYHVVTLKSHQNKSTTLKTSFSQSTGLL